MVFFVEAVCGQGMYLLISNFFVDDEIMAIQIDPCSNFFYSFIQLHGHSDFSSNKIRNFLFALHVLELYHGTGFGFFKVNDSL